MDKVKLQNYIQERKQVIKKLKEKLKEAEGFAKQKYEMDIEFWERRIKEVEEELECSN